MNRKLTAVLVAVVAVAAVGGGAALYADQNGGADAPDDVSAAAEGSTPTQQTEQPTETPPEVSDSSNDSASGTTDSASGGGADDAESDTGDSESDTDDAASGADDSASDADDANGTDAASADDANEPPTAEAGENRTVREWVRVEFDAASSSDPDGADANLSYEWSQVGGPRVDMVDGDTATPNFLAPDVRERTNYTFRLAVTDEDGATATDTVNVTVRPPKRDGPDNAETRADNETDNSTGETANDSDPAESGSSDGTDDSNADDSTDDASGEASRDAIARSVFDAEFEALSPSKAAVVEEFYMRQPDGEWDPATVKTRDELAREAYGQNYSELGFDGRVEVQEQFDAQFGDTGGELTKDEISQAKWNHDFANLSNESAGEITELYDRQPWVNEDNEHMPTRAQLAYRLYDAELSELTREQRLTVERRYNDQFVD